MPFGGTLNSHVALPHRSSQHPEVGGISRQRPGGGELVTQRCKQARRDASIRALIALIGLNGPNQPLLVLSPPHTRSVPVGKE